MYLQAWLYYWRRHGDLVFDQAILTLSFAFELMDTSRFFLLHYLQFPQLHYDQLLSVFAIEWISISIISINKYLYKYYSFIVLSVELHTTLLKIEYSNCLSIQENGVEQRSLGNELAWLCTMSYWVMENEVPNSYVYMYSGWYIWWDTNLPHTRCPLLTMHDPCCCVDTMN